MIKPFALKIMDYYIRRCIVCSAELDIEDFFFDNSCEYCGGTQGYDKEYFEVNERSVN